MRRGDDDDLDLEVSENDKLRSLALIISHLSRNIDAVEKEIESDPRRNEGNAEQVQVRREEKKNLSQTHLFFG